MLGSGGWDIIKVTNHHGTSTEPEVLHAFCCRSRLQYVFFLHLVYIQAFQFTGIPHFLLWNKWIPPFRCNSRGSWLPDLSTRHHDITTINSTGRPLDHRQVKRRKPSLGKLNFCSTHSLAVGVVSQPGNPNPRGQRTPLEMICLVKGLHWGNPYIRPA